MRTFTVVSAIAGLASAFPANMASDPAFVKRAAEILRRADILNDPVGVSKAQTNCGPVPCLIFDEAEQHVSTSGEHAYAAPKADEIRGPCPGLNAAANHGYLPRSGIASIEETVSGLGAAYALTPEISAALAAYAVAITGNVAETVWSIGGPLPTDSLTGALLGTGQGLSYSHNAYEGDASIGRDDAYINHGDAHSLNVSKFTEVYALGGPEDRYTLDKFRKQFGAVQQRSIATNPYYFTGLFSTVVVVPAAYNFVINLMSNHSAKEPSGYLDGYNFKSFFGITGEPGSFKWQRGQERIPDNWYRRPSAEGYTGNDVVEDVLITYLAYPETLLIGGNTGTTNSFTGVSLDNFSENFIGLKNLGEGDNFACFAAQLLQNGVPDVLNKPLSELNSVLNLLSKYIDPLKKAFNCPQIGQYDFTLFSQFPGYKYKPNGPATNY